MIQLRYIMYVILFITFIAIASHLDFLTEVQAGRAADSHGNVITMQDATWFCDRF